MLLRPLAVPAGTTSDTSEAKTFAVGGRLPAVAVVASRITGTVCALPNGRNLQVMLVVALA
jgi:hypothetical protein